MGKWSFGTRTTPRYDYQCKKKLNRSCVNGPLYARVNLVSFDSYEKWMKKNPFNSQKRRKKKKHKPSTDQRQCMRWCDTLVVDKTVHFHVWLHNSVWIFFLLYIALRCALFKRGDFVHLYGRSLFSAYTYILRPKRNYGSLFSSGLHLWSQQSKHTENKPQQQQHHK